MRKRSRQLEKSIVAVTLYRQDLVELFEILNKSGDGFYVRTDEFYFDDLEDFITSNKNKSFRNVRIQNERADFSILFNSSGVSVAGTSTSLQTSGLYNDVCHFLYQKQKSVFFGMSKEGFSIANGILTYTTFLAIGFNLYMAAAKALDINYIALLSVTIFTLGLISTYYVLNSKAILYMDRDYPSQGFLSRNKDLLLGNIIGAVVGGLIVLVAQLAISAWQVQK